MALTTYSELQSSIADFTNRDDLTSVIPDFITLAEAQMNRDIDHWQREERTTVTANSQYTALPSNFYQPRRLFIDGQDYPLAPMSINEMQDERDKSGDSAGRPKYYAITGGEIELFPTPDESETLAIAYIRTIPPLSSGNTSNWVLSEAPDVYLYGSLIHTAPYLKDDARVQIWAGLYQSAVAELNRTSVAARFGPNLRIRSNIYNLGA